MAKFIDNYIAEHALHALAVFIYSIYFCYINLLFIN